tara:strand:+ start:1921 stop:2700 length:780 start_codon:yes stop_codon:yes gene_type:complete
LKKLGIIQGRLSQPLNGFQECPVEWEKEFNLLEKLGLDHIEWIVTAKSLKNNPLTTQDLRPYKNRISSICLDNMVNKYFFENSFLENNLKPFCELALKNNISSISIPLLEESSVLDDSLRSKFCNNIKKYPEHYSSLRFLFEVEASHRQLADVLSVSDNFYATYDTGNITSCGYEHEEYINAVFDKISTVHIKDRTYDAKTVVPGTGDTNFKLIFDILKRKQYNGLYTLQTARENSGDEYQTISKHKNILTRIYNEKSF